MESKIKNIHLRVGIEQDAESIAQLGSLAFETAFKNENNAAELIDYLSTEYTAQAIAQTMSKPEVSFRVADSEVGIRGFTQLEDAGPPGDETRDALKMDRLYIHPSNIGTGLGKTLLQDAIELAKSRNKESLWLMVLRPNTRAVIFYRDFGFIQFGTSPGKFKGDAEIELWMKLDLKT